MYFTDCVVKAFPCDVFLKLCVCIKCKLRREDSLSFLVFFLTLRAQGMRKRWRRRQTRRFSPSPFFLLCFLLLSFLRLVREQNWEEEDVPFIFLVRLAHFWTRNLLDNCLLQSWAMRTILLILLIAFFAFYILEINLCQFSNLCLEKTSKVERAEQESGTHFYFAMTMGEYNIWSKKRFMKWNCTTIA